MVRDVNRVTLTGLIGRDPQESATGRGMTVLTLPVVVVSEKPGIAGSLEPVKTYVDVVVYGARAEELVPIARSGMLVTVTEGRIRSRSWRSGGQTRSALYVVADELALEDPWVAAGRERIDSGEDGQT